MKCLIFHATPDHFLWCILVQDALFRKNWFEHQMQNPQVISQVCSGLSPLSHYTDLVAQSHYLCIRHNDTQQSACKRSINKLYQKFSLPSVRIISYERTYQIQSGSMP